MMTLTRERNVQFRHVSSNEVKVNNTEILSGRHQTVRNANVPANEKNKCSKQKKWKDLRKNKLPKKLHLLKCRELSSSILSAQYIVHSVPQTKRARLE